jgi:TonB family protein
MCPSATSPCYPPKGRAYMKKTIFLIIALVLACSVLAEAANDRATVNNQVVVDRSTRNKVLNDYVMLARDAIQRAWKTPINLTTTDSVKGRVRINFSIKRSGALESIKLIDGSGHKEMDKSLMRAIKAAQPFPPFPDDVTAPRIVIRANFIVADLPTGRVKNVSQPIVGSVKTIDLPKIVAPEIHDSATDVPKAVRPNKSTTKPTNAKKAKVPKLKWGKAAGASKKSDSKDKPHNPSNQPEKLQKKSPKFHWGR